MKIMKKALALFIALIMVIGVVPAYAADSAGTISVSVVVTSDSKGTSPITSVKAEESFYLFINYEGNPTDLDATMTGYTLLFGYNKDKITINSKLNGDTSPTFNPVFAEGVFLGTWASLDGIVNDDGDLSGSGTLFKVKATALTDLVEDDLAKIKLVDSATGAETQETAMVNTAKDKFTINWVPTLQEEIVLEPITIQKSDFTVSLADQQYTGGEITPAVSSDTIPASVYTVKYDNNVELGEATITIAVKEGVDAFVDKQEYKGEVTFNFNIVAATIKEADFNLSKIVNTTYTGTAIKPAVTSVKLTEDVDYEVSYGNNTTVAEGGSVTVTGKGNYAGSSFTKTFNITPKTITKDDVKFTIDPNGYDYNDAPVEPPYTTTLSDDDYEVKYDNNNGAGRQGIITVTGKGNYTGSFTEKFTIKAKSAELGDDIGLAIVYTSTEKDAVSYDPNAKISSVEAGERFVMWVNISNNPVDDAKKTIGSYDLLLNYKSNEIKIIAVGDAATNPVVNTEFADNTIYAAWANQKGITAGMPAKLQPSATLFVVEAEALKTLDAAALKGVMTHTTEVVGTAKTAFMSNDLSTEYGIQAQDTLFPISDAIGIPTAPQVYTGSEIELELILNDPAAKYEVSYEANINVGTATVTVKGLENYYGEISADFEITPKSIVDAGLFELAKKQEVYTGSQIIPVINTALVEGVDYEVTYGNNVTVEEDGTVEIVGKGNYTGTVTLTFDIVSKEIKFEDFTVKEAAEYKDGAAIDIESEADLFVAAGLVLGQDYKVEYINNKAVGTATIIFEGINDYEGRVVKTFEIVARTLTGDDFTLDSTEHVYTGSEIRPTYTTAVTTLVPGKDYLVTYKDNVNVGDQAKVIFTGLGNYTGEVEKPFKITPKALNLEGSFEVDIPQNGIEYTGSAIEPSVKALLDDLVEGRDYVVKYVDNVNAGTGAKVVIEGKGNYDFTLEVPFEITPKPFTADDFELGEKQIVYTGSAITPKVISQLKQSIDFEVAYPDNINVGAKEAIITGKEGGNYAGTVKLAYTIVPKDIANVAFNFDLAKQTYNGEEKSVTIDTELVLVDDYTVRYEDNIDAGIATVIVEGAGNYTGKIVKNFTIDPAKLVNADFSFGNPEDWYEVKINEEALSKGVTVSVTSTNTDLQKDRDYVVTYTNNKADGKATVTVNGIGNYAGEVLGEFTINTYRLGDVDNDASWGTLDAIRVLKMATGLYTEYTPREEMAADVIVKGNSRFNAMDALEILKYSSLINGEISSVYGQDFGN